MYNKGTHYHSIIQCKIYRGKMDTVSPNDYLHSWTGGGSLISKGKGF